MNAALLVNILGFSVGTALYGLIGTMVIRHFRDRSGGPDPLLLATAVLGLLWNLGELYGFIQRDLGSATISPVIMAVSYSSLGFLPSVVVHSAQHEPKRKFWITAAAYMLSVAAALLHLHAMAVGLPVPSNQALQILTFGSLGLAAGLLIFNFRQTLEKKAVLSTALMVFAFSALHLSGEREGVSWPVELIAHQSSIPLALVILYQNYRFAFADLFLKRAISLMLLAGLALGLYVAAAVPLLRYHETHDRDDVAAAALIIGLWAGTALLYPAISRFARWLVDVVILRRADFTQLQLDSAKEIETEASVDGVLDVVARRLAGNLTAKSFSWRELDADVGPFHLASVSLRSDDTVLAIPTADKPQFEVVLGDLSGGRRLLSGEIALLEAIGLLAARRIDMIRISQERFEQRYREQEFARLAAEAQLTALRTQINPHFLFNALTTIGYLVKAAPDRAYGTLLRLTQLLRAILRSGSEFTTLGDELDLVTNYLDIERARFEERLRVVIDIPDDLLSVEVPSLILQPIVENAIKHGVSENKKGGTVTISASLVEDTYPPQLVIVVTDSGARTSVRKETETGVGLSNLQARLANHYGETARFELQIGGSNGTSARLELPLKQISTRARSAPTERRV